MTALGATRSQLGGFLWVEGLLVVAGGTTLGLITGFTIAAAMVAILAGVFDPPPEALSVPWLYLMVAIVSSFACGAIAIALMQTRSSKPDLEALRAG
ncbi:MAG: FtsX-like permease family protein [Alphaproteobacteria bacterium]|nr:FtsX-like permease family protein [Alphaproteobacteria bacterium]